MHDKKFADCFGITEDEISILLQYNDKEGQLDDIRQWYGGYRAGNDLHLYNPWSINSFICDGTLKAHWIDTGKHCLVAYIFFIINTSFLIQQGVPK
jgi:hypothetical protein